MWSTSKSLSRVSGNSIPSEGEKHFALFGWLDIDQISSLRFDIRLRKTGWSCLEGYAGYADNALLLNWNAAAITSEGSMSSVKYTGEVHSDRINNCECTGPPTITAFSSMRDTFSHKVDIDLQCRCQVSQISLESSLPHWHCRALERRLIATPSYKYDTWHRRLRIDMSVT